MKRKPLDLNFYIMRKEATVMSSGGYGYRNRFNGSRRIATTTGYDRNIAFIFFAVKTSLLIETKTGGVSMFWFIKIFGAIVGIWAGFKLGGIAIDWLNMLFENLKPKGFK